MLQNLWQSFVARRLPVFGHGSKAKHRRRALRQESRTEALELRLLLSSFAVINTNDSGAGSFRQAILDANATAGADSIEFAIPGSGLHTIQPLSALPTITDPVVIDGYTQPGTSANNLTVGNNAMLTVELDGSLAPATNGLLITAGNSTVRGLVINRFKGGGGFAGILLSGAAADNNVVTGNFIGTDVSGTVDHGNAGDGIKISAGSMNTIGGTSPSARNIISGNTLAGVAIDGANNFVTGNYIGTDGTGTADLGNSGRGVWINAANNTIGGTTAGAGNVISGNDQSGIQIVNVAASGNVILGNFIGTNAAGTAALGNSLRGVHTIAPNTQIGGTAPEARNIISGNRDNGVFIDGPSASGNVVAGNYIGTAANGTIDMPVSWYPFNTFHRDIVDGNQPSAVSGANAQVSGKVGSGLQLSTGGFVDVAHAANLANQQFTLDAWVRPAGAGPTNDALGSVIIEKGLTNTAVSATLRWSALDNRFRFGFGDLTTEIIASTSTFAPSSTVFYHVAGTYDGATFKLFVNGTLQGQMALVKTMTYDASIPWTIGAAAAPFRTAGSPRTWNGVLDEVAIYNHALAPAQIQAIVTADRAGRGGVVGNLNVGIFVNNAPNNVIGLPGAGNVTSGNRSTGILVSGAGSVGNVIQSNLVGTNADGTGPMGNGTHGVQISTGAKSTRIGTNADGTNDIAERNLISGNAFNGVVVGSAGTDDTVLAGNYVGTNAAGDRSISNGNFFGVLIADSAKRTRIGTDGLKGALNAAERNLISGNTIGVGVSDAGTTDTVIAGNWVGLNGAGTGVLPNAGTGIELKNNASLTRIGTNADGQGDVDERNVVSGNGSFGIVIRSGANANVVAGNFIGTDVTGTLDFGNSFDGVYMLTDAGGSSFNNTIGGTAAVARNLISGNNGDGIEISGSGSSNNTVIGNYIGTDVSGNLDLGNSQDGVRVVGATNNTIGGTAAGARNVISGNNSVGIEISTSTGTFVQGNYLGTNAAGTGDLGNSIRGVAITGSSSNNLIGGTTAAARNIISGNAVDGVYIAGAATGNAVQGNYIGTDVTGQLDLGNDVFGVRIESASGNTIGGTAAGAGNLISGNSDPTKSDGAGLAIIASTGNTAANNVVQGNLIGTNASGTAALGNSKRGGVSIQEASNNLIGGTTPEARNVISGNSGQGVLIGGGTNPGNAMNNSVRGNSIYGNSGLGIDLGANGITPNDSGDGDSGPNDLQNFPVLTSAITMFGTTTIEGTLNSTPSATFVLDFYSNAVGDPSGNGEGETCLGSTTVITDVLGNATFTATLAGSVSEGHFVVATATNSGGSTSEFSGSTTVINPCVTNTNDSGPGSLRQAMLDANLSVGIVETICFDIPISDPGYNPGTGAFSIKPLSQLPVIFDTVTIDATTQPGFTGTPIIEIDGSLAGAADGLRIVAANNTVRGLVINRFAQDGIDIQPGGNNLIAGNYLGTDVTGTIDLGNGASGIAIESNNNQVQGNLISGNQFSGITISTSTAGATSSGNVIQANRIGTNALGNADLGNTRYGIDISRASNNTVTGNIVGGNDDYGIILDGSNNPAGFSLTTGNVIVGNDLGGSAGNAGGIIISQGASNTTIGGTASGEGNLIANNGAGVVVSGSAGTGNVIRGNSISQNNGPGIDLGSDGVTANDTGDADAGPNDFQNFPGIGLVATGATTQVTGTLNSTPNTTFTLDFYANAALDPSKHGEGERYLGSTTVATDGGGNVSFNVILAAATTSGEFITATATDPTGNTSEFSGRLPTAVAGGPYAVPEGGSLQLNGSGSSDPDQVSNTLTYQWDLDGDNVFGETGVSADRGNEVGAMPTFSAAGLDGLSVLSVTLRVTDTSGLRDEDAVTITINNANPTIGQVANSGPVNEGSSVTVTVTADDPAGANDPLSYEFDFDNDFVYEVGPQASSVASQFFVDNGIHRVNVRVTDGDLGLATSFTDVAVNNVSPTANADSGATNEDTVLNVAVSGVLGNDTDPAGASDPLTVTGFTAFSAKGAIVVVNSNGSYSYDPRTSATLQALATGQTTTDTFSYDIDDGDGGTATAAVTITVSGVNDLPNIASNNTTVTVNEGTTGANSGTFADVDSTDSVTLTASIGTVTQTGTNSGTWNWSFNTNDGPDQTQIITITATDSDGAISTTTFNLVVNNVAPTATNDAYGTNQGAVASGNVISDALADSDPAGANDPLTVTSFTQPANGSVTLAANGSFTYTPAATFSGTDSFSYSINDGDGGTATATVTITVAPPAAGSVTTVIDTCEGGTALLINGTSAGDHIVVELGTSPGTLRINLNGTITTVGTPSGRIIVLGDAGDDNIQIAGSIMNSVWAYGDAGHDRIFGGGGACLLFGGDGNDQLTGGSGRDILIGGQGGDKLVGNSNDDVLIAGYTTKDSRATVGVEEFWCQVMQEWNSTNSFADRLANLRGADTQKANAHNGTSYLLPVVMDDTSADQIDMLQGSSGNDWFIYRAGEDKVVGQLEAAN